MAVSFLSVMHGDTAGLQERFKANVRQFWHFASCFGLFSLAFRLSDGAGLVQLSKSESML